jgi:hypothetical protein
MMSKRYGSEQWDRALDGLHAKRGEVGQSDRWLKANHPEFVDERRSFYERTPWHRFRASVVDRVERYRMRRRMSLSVWLSGLGVAVSAGVALLLMVPSSTSLVNPSDVVVDTIRVKGSTPSVPPAIIDAADAPEWMVFADGQRVESGAVITAGALLTFRLNSYQFDHVIVFGVEEDGSISPYYPERASGQSVLVGQGRGIPLPGGVRLDGRLGRERFVAVFSKMPLAWRVVQDAAQKAWNSGAFRVGSMRAVGLDNTAEATIWFDKQQ